MTDWKLKLIHTTGVRSSTHTIENAGRTERVHWLQCSRADVGSQSAAPQRSLGLERLSHSCESYWEHTKTPHTSDVGPAESRPAQSKEGRLDPKLKCATQVFVQVGRAKRPLESSYDGPYEVVLRNTNFRIIGGWIIAPAFFVFIWKHKRKRASAGSGCWTLRFRLGHVKLIWSLPMGFSWLLEQTVITITVFSESTLMWFTGEIVVVA